jgi:hypothetical protein
MKCCVIIKSGTQYINLKPEEICYMEGSGNYMTVNTSDRTLMSLPVGSLLSTAMNHGDGLFFRKKNL